jgi:hypothetical protein
MNALRDTMLGLAIAMGGWECAAQEATIPFGQIERNAQLYARLTVQDDDMISSLSSSSLTPEAIPVKPSIAGFVRVPPATALRTLNSKFFLLNGLHLGLALSDVVMTQHCIAAHTCREGNPLMPSSLAGQVSVDLALISYGSYISYRLKRYKSNLWWISPAIGIAAHSAGLATGVAHQ